MKPFDPRLIALAQQAKVRPPHVFHLIHAVAQAPVSFDPVGFAAFTGLEQHHVARIIAAVESAGLMPARRRPNISSTEAKGTRLPSVMVLPSDWLAFAQSERQWDAKTVEGIFQEFIDYWHAAPGQRGVKADWLATWRNWVRRSKTPNGTLPKERNGYVPRTEEQIRRAIDAGNRYGFDVSVHEAALKALKEGGADG